MARSGRPASESYQSDNCSPGQTLSSRKDGILEDEDDRAPIFSLSKSSVDVVMATGSPQKRDPVWSRLNLKRSSSTNTHSDQNQMTLQQLHQQKWRHNSQRFSLTTQNEGMISPTPLSERWISNMHRWSGCSGSTHSRSSTPDTVVWKGESSNLCSLNQEAPSSSTSESPTSKLTSPPTTPSPFISPFHTPTLPPEDISSTSSPLTLRTCQQLPESSPHPWSTRTHHESSEKLLFQFPSPVPSHFSLADAEECSDAFFVNDTKKELFSPGDDLQLEGEKPPVQKLHNFEPNSPSEREETQNGSSGVHFLLLEQSCLMDQGRRSTLVSSLSDSCLGYGSEGNMTPRVGALKSLKLFQEKGTMTQLEMVDAAVQTVSPLGSCCDLRRDMSASNTESHSFLGSPPGSRLNLKFPVGSHSNLVSASSSMFPVSSEEEEEKKQDNPEWDTASGSPFHLVRRRSCLKLQQEELNEQGRRGSMKQVQWDEDGLTWEVHGASLDPEELTTAIQKHIELKNSPKPLRRSSKKKKAPMPPLISNMVTTMDSDASPPAMSIKCMVEGGSEDTLAEDTGKVKQEAENKKQETEEVVLRKSRTEQDNAKEMEEVHKEEVVDILKSPGHGSERSKKKTKLRSLRRPGWCGSSRKTDD